MQHRVICARKVQKHDGFTVVLKAIFDVLCYCRSIIIIRYLVLPSPPLIYTSAKPACFPVLHGLEWNIERRDRSAVSA